MATMPRNSRKMISAPSWPFLLSTGAAFSENGQTTKKQCHMLLITPADSSF